MILLLGATGYVGRAFSAELRHRALPFMPLTRTAIDYTRFDVLFNFVRNTRPDFIINAAGYTGNPDVDACEVHRAETVQANTLLPQTVARVSYLTKTPWGHVSSGCIYSGAWVTRNGAERIERNLDQPEIRRLFETRPGQFRGFTEADEPNFSFRSPSSNFYSGTKALAEEALRWFDECYLWRPRLMFDEFDEPRNLLSKLQRHARILDGVHSLSHRADFVRSCLDLWERHGPFGTYNVVNPGAVTTRHIVERIKRLLKPAREFEFWEDTVEFLSAGTRAQRPHCILDPGRLLSLGIEMRPVEEALEHALANWRPPAANQEWLATSLKSPLSR
jgi:UDP-glucose 4,6-dehydratase